MRSRATFLHLTGSVLSIDESATDLQPVVHLPAPSNLHIRVLMLSACIGLLRSPWLGRKHYVRTAL
jgi:hypothetical protein